MTAERPAQATPVRCPVCTETIPENATRCPHCLASLPFPPDSQWSSRPTPLMWAALGCAAIGVLLLLATGVFLAVRFL